MKKSARTVKSIAVTDIGQSNGSIGTDAAKLLAMIQNADYPEFISRDGFVKWKHRNLTAESFLAIGDLPSKFTDQIRKTYEQSVNLTSNKTAKQSPESAAKEQSQSEMTADEFMKVLKAIIINTAISPKFHEGENDPANNLLNIEAIRNYWQEYYLYIMANMANGGRQIQAGEGAVSAEMLERFSNKEREPEQSVAGANSEVLGEKSFRVVAPESPQ